MSGKLLKRHVLVFRSVMGFLWLATVPATSGLVAVMFGTRYMALLYGIVFLGHQLGSFSGVWLGGWLYDRSGSYDFVWWTGVVLQQARRERESGGSAQTSPPGGTGDLSGVVSA